MSIFPQHPRLSIFQQHTTQLVKHMGGVGNAHRIVNKAARGNQSMGNLSSKPLCALKVIYISVEPQLNALEVPASLFWILLVLSF